MPHETDILRSTIVDVSALSPLEDMGLLLEETRGESEENEIALRKNKRYVNRLVRSSKATDQPNYETYEQHKGEVFSFVSHPKTRMICKKRRSMTNLRHGEVDVEISSVSSSQELCTSLTTEEAYVAFTGKVITPSSRETIQKDWVCLPKQLHKAVF